MMSSIKTPLFALTFSIIAFGSEAFCMNPNQLCFYLNGNRQIKSYSAHGNMEFYVEPKEFEGKDIVEVLPLSEITRKAILQKFDIAAQENKIVAAAYSLENENYVSEITPLTGEFGNSYFVKVLLASVNTYNYDIPDIRRLCLYMNNARKIEAASAHGGIQYVASVPLSQEGTGYNFDIAAKENKIVNTVYDYAETIYDAEITPLTNQDLDNGYFVTVREK